MYHGKEPHKIHVPGKDPHRSRAPGTDHHQEKNPGTGYYQDHDPAAEHEKGRSTDRGTIKSMIQGQIKTQEVPTNRWEH